MQGKKDARSLSFLHKVIYFNLPSSVNRWRATFLLYLNLYLLDWRHPGILAVSKPLNQLSKPTSLRSQGLTRHYMALFRKPSSSCIRTERTDGTASIDPSNGKWTLTVSGYVTAACSIIIRFWPRGAPSSNCWLEWYSIDMCKKPQQSAEMMPSN